MRGRVFNERWEVKQRIGRGGTASVYEGFDHRLGRPVAIKILHTHLAQKEDARLRLAREARAIAHLNSENVIQVYDYSIDEPDCSWLVTELIEGPSLRDILENTGRLMPELAAMIAVELVRALRAAHATGVVHRDVKPGNILIGKDGRPKLSDFGIAHLEDEQQLTVAGTLVGSPNYMSPEQANGAPIDHRTDLYSAGMILYRMVTGALPFPGETVIETIRKVSRGVFIDPVELEPECGGAIAGIVRRAMAMEIEHRYQTADEMLNDLMLVLHDAGLSATWIELPKFFADPVAYQQQLKQQLKPQPALPKTRRSGLVQRTAWITGFAVAAIGMISGAFAASTSMLVPVSYVEPIKEFAGPSCDVAEVEAVVARAMLARKAEIKDQPKAKKPRRALSARAPASP